MGFSNRWYRLASQSAVQRTLDNGLTINLITAACFLATKMEAFDSPHRENGGDLSASRDFEDVVTVLDGRPSIAEDVNSADVEARDYLRKRFARLMLERYWMEGIEAHLIDPGRAQIIAERLRNFTHP